jgi:hypothetical protein
MRPAVRTAAAAVVAAVAGAAACGAMAGPASTSGPATGAPAPLLAFADASDAACRQLVPPLLARPDFAGVLKRRAIDIADVCRCVRGQLLADARLAPRFAGEPAEVDARLRTPELNSYLSMRLVSSAFACTSQEMERSLEAAPTGP